MPNVSIILPIYKKEKYLKKCLESILNQTFSSFELICINDASPDKCLNILKEFSKKDTRMKIVNYKENMGAAYCRNVGIDMAKGEYILILDADDIFMSDLVERTYKRCKKEQADVMLFDYIKYDEQTGVEKEYTMPLTLERRLSSDGFCKDDISNFIFQISIAAPWTKVYKSEYIKKNNLYFQNISSSNDVFFGKMVLIQATRICYLKKSLVKYRNNNVTQISNNKKDAVTNFIKAVMQIKKEIKKRGYYGEIYRSFNAYVLRGVMMHFYETVEECKGKVYEQIIVDLFALFDGLHEEDIFLNKYSIFQARDFCNIDYSKHAELGINNEYQYMFDYEFDKILKIVELCNSDNADLVIWGYGKNGKRFTDECKRKKIQVDYIIDAAYGGKMEDVHLPEAINEKKCVILVASASLVKSIVENVSSMQGEFKVIDIQMYMTYGLELEECTYAISS